MGNKDIVADAKDRQNHMHISVKYPSNRYIDEFLDLECGPELMMKDIFPNSKEISESYAVYNAVRNETNRTFIELDDEEINVFSVGDGSTPRTSALFAYMTKFKCHSIDPQLKGKEYPDINRLELYPTKIQEQEFECEKAILLAVHNHSDLQESLDRINADKIIVVAMPCCEPQELEDREPDKVYSDWGCLSPEREIKIWRL